MLDIVHEDENSGARVGEFTLRNLRIKTPTFLPVATKADVKLVSPRELKEIGVRALIANAFVLYLRPGLDVIVDAGGIHKFMGWDDVIFTDSGGFQMLNEDFLLKVDEDKVTFKSPFDGKRHEITPEKCAEIQMKLGTDVALTLDDCPAFGADYDHVLNSAKRTLEWAKRFKKIHRDNTQLVFGISQGGVFEDLRKSCTKSLVELDFEGYAIGGLCIGEPKDTMHQVVEWTTQLLPKNKPRYLMGVGSPEDMLKAISCGVDIFDSVFPTRNARHNTVYTKNGKINIGKEKYNRNFGPIDEGCECHTCKNFTLSYVNHLLREHEYLGMRLATIHNLYFLVKLMSDAKKAIADGKFSDFEKEFCKKYLNRA